ncbi:hypothetical protein NDU88_003022 [Pleurodeles waltl]|uniref:Uncharacterized protein n=1 Tax=Pleurodeles waltl TaxID=8319 RepID=A0AAV7QBL2_PLEWA|nr:hypothetical protein NDU88_003022 [Pleurodeles waltl]
MFCASGILWTIIQAAEALSRALLWQLSLQRMPEKGLKTGRIQLTAATAPSQCGPGQDMKKRGVVPARAKSASLGLDIKKPS